MSDEQHSRVFQISLDVMYKKQNVMHFLFFFNKRQNNNASRVGLPTVRARLLKRLNQEYAVIRIRAVGVGQDAVYEHVGVGRL